MIGLPTQDQCLNRRDWVEICIKNLIVNNGGNAEDITLGVATALDAFDARLSAATAIEQGFNAAHRRIKDRQAQAQAIAHGLLCQIISRQRQYHPR